MDGTGRIMLCEISQKEKQIPDDFTHTWEIEKQIKGTYTIKLKQDLEL